APGAAHLECARTGQLEHLPVEQEEPRQPEAGDQLKLLAQPFARLRANDSASRSVALGERFPADPLELPVGRVGAVGEVGVAVAELLRQVEGAPLGDLAGAGDRIPGQPLASLLGRSQDALVVPTTLALAAVQRRAAA